MKSNCFIAFATHVRTIKSFIASLGSLNAQLRKKNLDSTVNVVLTNDNFVEKLTVQVLEKKSTIHYNLDSLFKEEGNHISVYFPSDLSKETCTSVLEYLSYRLFRKMINSSSSWLIKPMIFQDKRLLIELKEEKIQQAIPEKTKETLMLIDGSNLLASSYFATSYKRNSSQLLQTTNGIYTNGINTMLKRILNLCQRYRPSHIAICWDVSRKTFRRDLFPEYKANRPEMEPELEEQFETAKYLFSKMNIAQFSVAGYEADDLIAAVHLEWTSKAKGKVYIVSTDQDLYQLLERNTIIIQQKRSEDVEYSLETFNDEYNISPAQWIDVKALVGDSSDNIPGIRGIGIKTALPLVQEYGNLDFIYQYIHSMPKASMNKTELKLYVKEDKAFLSKKLATVETNIPSLSLDLEKLKINIDRSAMIKELQRLELLTLLSDIRNGKYKAS